MINRGIMFTLLLFASISVASADYADAMRAYERQNYRQALQMFDSLAASGDADAQYMLGRMYEAGTGTLQNYVEAHKWYNLAVAGGHRHAAAARDAVATRMTAQQIAEAQQAARAWQPTATSPPLVTTPPAIAAQQPSFQTLSNRELVAGVQRELNRLGYNAGPVDGVMGTRTRNAIRDYQSALGLPRNGQPTAALLARLQQEERTPGTLVPGQPAPLPATRIALDDDFSDGDFRRNPPWTVLSGRFEVDDNGLRTSVAQPRVTEPAAPAARPGRPEEIGLAVLQMILEQAGGLGPEAAPAPEVGFAEPARIAVRAPVGNAFELELVLASHQRPGSVELGLFQGDRPGAGYRLVYNAGSQPGLSLVRLTADGGAVIASSEGPLNLEDGRFHTLNWSRDEDGLMQVRVDGRRVLQGRDRSLRQGFQGFVLVNHGGDYNLRRVRLEG